MMEVRTQRVGRGGSATFLGGYTRSLSVIGVSA